MRHADKFSHNGFGFKPRSAAQKAADEKRSRDAAVARQKRVERKQMAKRKGKLK